MANKLVILSDKQPAYFIWKTAWSFCLQNSQVILSGKPPACSILSNNQSGHFVWQTARSFCLVNSLIILSDKQHDHVWKTNWSFCLVNSLAILLDKPTDTFLAYKTRKKNSTHLKHVKENDIWWKLTIIATPTFNRSILNCIHCNTKWDTSDTLKDCYLTNLTV